MSDTAYEKASVINDDFRDASLNRRYYSCLLHRAKQFNLALDVIVAVGTSGAVAAWNIWQVGDATYIWKSLAAVATLIAIIKPFLNLPKEIERYSELVAGWANVFYDLKRVTVRMRTTGSVTEEIWCAYEPTQQRLKELGVKDDPAVNEKLRRRCFEEVNRQTPLESLWWPEESTNEQREASQIPAASA